MSAVLYDDAVSVPTAPTLAPKQASRRYQSQPVSGDPLVDAVARLLTIPLRELYAVLWRMGVIEVRAEEAHKSAA